MNLQVSMIVDALLLLQALWVVLQVSDRSIFNPGLWYIALHSYSVTFRLITLNLGFESGAFTGVRSDAELVQAATACDISLIAMVVATVWIAHRTEKNWTVYRPFKARSRLNSSVGWTIAVFCLTLGSYALIRFDLTSVAATRGVDIGSPDTGDVNLSSIPRIIGGFAVQGPLILCAIKGFTFSRIILLTVLLAAASLGLARVFFVLPFLFAVLIYQSQHRRHTLSPRWILLLACLGVIWFAFKPFVQGLRTGESVSTALGDAGMFLEESGNVAPGDIQFLDMQARYMTIADESGLRFHGATILPVIYLPIPRFLWPDKPRLNEYATQLGSGPRSIVQEGITPNLTGEAYLDFGFLGCAVVPFLYLAGLQSMFQRVKHREISDPARWLYLVLLMCMVQVYRDGLISFFLFPLVDFLPLTSWGLISLLLPSQRSRHSEVRPLPVRVATVGKRIGV